MSLSQSDANASINHQASQRIIRVDDYTHMQLDQLKSKYAEMIDAYNENIDDIKLKNKHYQVES